MKVYIVKHYSFFNSNGVEYQCANCGETGTVFTSKKRAEKYFNKCAEDMGVNKIDIKLFPYQHFEYHFNTRHVMTLQEVETM